MKTGEEIRRRLLRATNEEELEAVKDALKQEGVPSGTIRGIISRLRKQGKLVFERVSQMNEQQLTIMEMLSFLMESMTMLCNKRVSFLEDELQLARFEERQWEYFREFFKRLMKQV